MKGLTLRSRRPAPVVLGSACSTTQLAQSVVQPSINPRPSMGKTPDLSVVPVSRRKIGTYGRTALALGQSAYKLQFLVRTRLGWQRDFVPPIWPGDSRSGNPGHFEPGLLA